VPDDEETTEQDAPQASTRPFWSGTLSFGLVSIPVSLFPATRRAGVSLRMLAPDGTPLARRYYCPEDGKELDDAELARGYELDDGSYVVISDEELEAVDPKKSRDIDLRAFVPAAQLDPLYFDRSYVLTSASDSTKAYRLLAELMERTERAGIATFVMREKEYLVAIFAHGGILRAETLRFHDEVRSADDLDLPSASRSDPTLVKSFANAIAELAADELDVEQLHGEQTAALRKRIAAKQRRGEDVITGEELETAEAAEVIDLMDVLKRSLQGEAPAEPRTHSRGPRRPAKVRPRAADLGELSKDELLERARALGVRGRSQMSKSELALAVRRTAR
jgi:DNA end-binding protein Ku